MALTQTYVPDAGGGGAPSGPAGGVLSGTYPDPGFAVDMATQAELNAVDSALDARVDALETAGALVNANRFRIHIDTTSVGNFAALAEIALHATVGGSNVLTGGTASASTAFNASFDAAKALDGNLTTAWVTTSGSVPAWWQYDLASAVDFAEVVLTARNGADYTQAPTRFSVLASTDSGATWFTVREFFTTWASANQVKTFAL